MPLTAHSGSCMVSNREQYLKMCTSLVKVDFKTKLKKHINELKLKYIKDYQRPNLLALQVCIDHCDL